MMSLIYIAKRICIILLALSMVGCAKKEASRELHSEADLAGLKVGVTAGSAYDLRLSKRNDITLMRYNTLSDELQALKQRQIDVIAKDNCSLTKGEMQRLGVRVAFFGNDSLPCGIPFRKSDVALCDSLSHFIDSLQASGELERLVAYWRECDDPSTVAMPDLGPQPHGKTLKVGVSLELAPIAYQVGDAWMGFEAEVIQRFGRYVGRPVTLQYYPFSSILPALQAGSIDLIIGGVYITEERQREMLFSSSYFSACTAYTVRDSEGTSTGFTTRLKEMVHNNLIVENRWHYIVDGLWETTKISLCAILLGSLLGAVVCWMRMSRRRWVSGIAAVYINLMRGIPMLVFLMIMFYVVFAGTGLSGSTVAVISFALVFAAYVSEMFRTAIQAVGKEQTEAGLALGFTKWQTARLIVAPQAIRNVMPVYKGQVVTLIKGTSIVGYIAIQDLTRAGDIIRTRTFDAFFPLLIVTVLYFLLAWFIGKVLDLSVGKTIICKRH